MSRDWEHNLTSIVQETESNLARVRRSLNDSRYSHKSLPNSHPISSFSVKSSTLPRRYMTSSSYLTDYTGRSEWQPHSGYQSPFAHGSSFEGESAPSSLAESPALVAMLTEKIDNQAKTIQTLSRQVDALEKERDRSQTHLQRLDQELTLLNRRLQEGGVQLETERKVEGWKREVTLQLGDLQSQVVAQHRNASGGGYRGDEVLDSLTREVHDFKRHMQEDLALCRRDIESLNTRLMRQEIDIGNNQADGKDFSRRMDHMDRTLTSIADSQRSHSRELSHTLLGKQTSEQELLQLQSEMSRMMSTVERLENDMLTSSQRIAKEQSSTLKLNSPHRNNLSAVNSHGLSTSKEVGQKKKKAASGRISKPSRKIPSQPFPRLPSDSEDLDASVSLSLASSESDDSSLDLLPHGANNIQRSAHTPFSRDDESSDAFSEMTSALVGHDPTLDLVDLASTSSISSIELDADLL
ncbi:uncharacterized protein LOC110989584 isoform X2 [Acanthaster planci]|uniref:Uncharacterized protein LOC110989584 isoform X2 n=1 Tax=Acanthaster planci TaxID=133434 RepID=A0A8B7ZYE9_ACAPL|nr:uncharacterized protein LOC110989584 isoform X2 [Acanthaster planci]